MNLFYVTQEHQETFHHSHESLCHLSFGELLSENVLSKREKITKIRASSEKCFFGNKTQVI